MKPHQQVTMKIREEILKALKGDISYSLPVCKKHLAYNFQPLPKLREEYGDDEVSKVLGEMEDNGEIYWLELHPGYNVIKRTEKSFQQV